MTQQHAALTTRHVTDWDHEETNADNADRSVCVHSVTHHTLHISSIDSPLSASITHSLFHSTLRNFPFLQILPAAAFLFFFRTDSTDSPDCLPILLSIYLF